MELPLVSLHKYVEGLDDSAIITFQAFSEEKQLKLKELMDRANDQLKLERAYRKQQSIIFKPEVIKLGKDFVYFKTKAGKLAIELTDDLLDCLIEFEGTSFYAKAKVVGKYGKSYKIDQLEIYTAEKDTDTAKELLQEYNPLDLLCYALGYKPEPEVKAVILPKLLSIFKPYEKAIHVVQFTSPRLGKTESAKLLAELSNGYYCGVLPKRTKLIYNASLGSYGLAYYYDTLFIDEFDKLSGQRLADFKESYEILLSGMDNGIWQRESSSSKASDFKRYVGLCFMGNIRNHELPTADITSYHSNARKKLEELLKSYGIDYPNPFIERISYVEFLNVSWQIYRAINYNGSNLVSYLNPAVSRGIIEILRAEAKKVAPAKKVECQLDYHFNCLKAVLTVLGLELDDDTIEKLVKGELTFWNAIVEEKLSSSISSAKPEDNAKEESETKEKPEVGKIPLQPKPKARLFWDEDKPAEKSKIEELKAKNLELAKKLNAKAIRIKGEVRELDDLDFSMESALGIERESIEDFLEDEPAEKEAKAEDSSNFSEQADDKAIAEAEQDKEQANEDEAIEYVTVKIIDYCSPAYRIFTGVDGKIYHIPHEGACIKIPKLNAIPLVEAGVAVIVPEGMSKEELDKLVNGYEIQAEEYDLAGYSDNLHSASSKAKEEVIA